MTVPLVTQLRFARSEFQRCLAGLSPEDGVQRLLPMNCISWMVGHLAHQENAYWIYLGQAEVSHPGLRELVGTGKPASTPPLEEMQAIWADVTRQADLFLDGLTLPRLQEFIVHRGKTLDESIGNLLQRNIYHYWFHTGEAHAVRQKLGHTQLPDFVGDMQGYTYRPE